MSQQVSLSSESSYLLQMPGEILLNIVANLPLSDCSNLQDIVKKNPFHKVHEDRMSPEIYFSNNLCNGSKLMKLLAETDAYCTGSNAYNYFRPDLATSESDWNFVLPPDQAKIQHFMLGMEKLNVTWEHIGEYFERTRFEGVNFALRLRKFRYYMGIDRESDSTNKWKGLTNLKETIASFGRDKDNCYIMVSPGGKYRQTKFYFMESLDDTSVQEVIGKEKFKVDDMYSTTIHGTMVNKNRKVKITLSYPDDSVDSHVSLLMLHPTNITQCSISAFGAVHMYKEVVKSRAGKSWLERYDYLPVSYSTSREYLSKYTLRNYTVKRDIFTAISTRTYRHALDNKSVFIPFENKYNWNYRDWQIAHQKLCYLTWIVEHGSIRFKHIINSQYGFSIHGISKYNTFRKSLLTSVDIDYLESHGVFV